MNRLLAATLASPYTAKSLATLARHRASGAYDQARALKLLRGNVRYAARSARIDVTYRDTDRIARLIERNV